MTSDRDIEEYTTQHYNPNKQTPEEWINSTSWGSEARAQVSLNRAEEMYKAINPDELTEYELEQQRLEAQEGADIQEEQERLDAQEQEQQEEQEQQNPINRAANFVRNWIRGIFG